MPEYAVHWSLLLSAPNPYEAAAQALDAILRPGAHALAFEVVREDGPDPEEVTIDLANLPDGFDLLYPQPPVYPVSIRERYELANRGGD